MNFIILHNILLYFTSLIHIYCLFLLVFTPLIVVYLIYFITSDKIYFTDIR